MKKTLITICILLLFCGCEKKNNIIDTNDNISNVPVQKDESGKNNTNKVIESYDDAANYLKEIGNKIYNSKTYINYSKEHFEINCDVIKKMEKDGYDVANPNCIDDEYDVYTISLSEIEKLGYDISNIKCDKNKSSILIIDGVNEMTKKVGNVSTSIFDCEY